MGFTGIPNKKGAFLGYLTWFIWVEISFLRLFNQID